MLSTTATQGFSASIFHMRMRFHTRLGLAICLSFLSIATLILLIPDARVDQLQKIALGAGIDKYTLWRWGSGSEDGDENSLRLVVFGDSWVDDRDNVQSAGSAKGGSWADVLCEEINCTSILNLAVSQPSQSYPAFPPAGAVTSNKIYASLTTSSYRPQTSSVLPDFATQIQEFITLSKSIPAARDTVFVVSFGLWDVYQLAGLDGALAQDLTDISLAELFTQLDILYSYYVEHLPNNSLLATQSMQANNTLVEPSFRVIIPKLSDPTLLPGWMSQRPVPLTPTSIAEQQKNAVYLTERWNSILENKMAHWLQVTPDQKAQGNNTAACTAFLPKDIFYCDIPKFILDLLVEHQLEDENLADASGLGTYESPFRSVYQPCIREAGEGDTDGQVDLFGKLVCKEPEEYLFWDDFRLGVVANEAIGRAVGKMMVEGKSIKGMLKEEAEMKKGS